MTGTVDAASHSQSIGPKSSVSIGSQHRAGLMPEEIRSLSKNEGFLLGLRQKKGQPYTIIGRRAYFDPASREFKGRFDQDPYHPKA